MVGICVPILHNCEVVKGNWRGSPSRIIIRFEIQGSVPKPEGHADTQSDN